MEKQAETLKKNALILRDAVEYYLNIDAAQHEILAREVAELIDALTPLEEKYKE